MNKEHLNKIRILAAERLEIVQANRLRPAIFNQRGVTLVELLVVFAILGIVASIALGEFYHRRTKAYDKQAVAIAKHLLTLAATSFASDEIPVDAGNNYIEGSSVGTYPDGYPELQANPGIHTKIEITDNGNGDFWSFYVASEGGSTAYFFWLPGPDCVEASINNSPSDTLVDNLDYNNDYDPDLNCRASEFGI